MSRVLQPEIPVPDREQSLDKDDAVEEMVIPAVEARAGREEPVVTRKVGALLASGRL